MTREIEWIEVDVTLAFHRRQIAEYGGSEGVRDRGLLESALARPKNLHAYGAEADIPASLAAAYAFGVAKNHAFIDGNKRTALVVATAFLDLNGYELVDRSEIFDTILNLANGQIDEDELAQWFRENIVEA